VGRIHCRAIYLALVLLLLAGSIAAFGSKKAPKLAETIDLPLTFESDFQSAAKQRAQLGSQREVPDNIAGRVGEDVFESLVKNEMISDLRLPYTWMFRSYDSPDVNAFSLADGEVVAFAGLSRLIGTNRGLWAAVLAHEIAHVARRHAVRKALG
jgi:Zn-dependent protease with chaperone function